MTASTGARGPSRGRGALPFVLFFLLVVAVYSPTLFSRRNFAGRDLLVYNLPIEKAIHESYSNGELPVWIPEISGGRPLAANPNAGAFYPVRPLLSLLPFPVAMRIYPVLHWAAAGLGMLLLLRSLGGSKSAAWVGAVTYAFSGVAVAEVFYSNYQPGMTLLPWIVWAVQRRNVSEGSKLLTLSLLYGLIFFAGDVFTIGIAVFSSFLWIMLERERPERLREVVLLGLSLLLAGLLAAPQIIASALWVPDTNRAILGMRLRDALLFSVSPLRLLELVVPFPFGPTWSLEDARIWGWPVFREKTIGFFTTFYAGALSVIALTATWKWRPAGARFARVLFLFAVAVSVLPSFLPAASSGFPSPLPLRFPEKFAVAFVFALAILSGLAFDRFRAGAPRPRWIFAAGAVLAILAGAAALFPDRAASIAVEIVGAPPVPRELPEATSDPVGVARREVPLALAEGGLLWIATVVALELVRRRGRGSLATALVLLTAVPLASNKKIARTLSEEVIFQPSPFARFLDGADPDGRYRTLGESFYRRVSPLQIAHASDPAARGESWVEYRQVLAGRGTVFNFDFDVGDFARLESLRRVSSQLSGRSGSEDFFANFSLRFGIRFRDQEPLPGYRRVGGTTLQDWDELAGALPDVRLAEIWVEERGPLEAAQALRKLARGELVIETGTPGRGRARPGSVRVLAGTTAAELSIETEAPDPTWLFVLRGFWDHRDVRVDGRLVDSFPAQLAFSALPLAAGRHKIVWSERLPGSDVSRWGPALFALLMAGLLIRDRRTAK